VDQSIELTVDCTNGYSLNDLLGAAGNRVSRTTININGFCNKQVNLFKSNVTFRPAPGSSNLGDLSFMEVTGSTSVKNNGGYGLFCSPSPAVTQYKVCCGNQFNVYDNSRGDPSKPQINCRQAGSPGI